MAMIFMDGFDQPSIGQLAYRGWGAGNWAMYAMYTGRFGVGQCLQVWEDSTISHSLPSTYSALIVGFAMVVPSNSYSGNSKDRMTLGSVKLGTIDVGSGQYVWAITDLTGTTQGTTRFTTGGWNYVEAKIVFHGSTGTVELRVNGLPTAELSATGRNTGAGVSGFNLRNYWPPSSYFDDIYFCDTTGPAPNNDFLGDIRVEYLVPTGAGAKTNFTPSAATNWQTVDEAGGASDADYNSDNVPGAMDLFAMSNLSGNGLVFGVQPSVRAWKSDAGFRTVKAVAFMSNGTGETARYYPSLKFAVGDSPAFSTRLMSLSPDTNVAWTVAEVNALQFGYMVGEASMFTLDARLV